MREKKQGVLVEYQKSQSKRKKSMRPPTDGSFQPSLQPTLSVITMNTFVLKTTDKKHVAETEVYLPLTQ